MLKNSKTDIRIERHKDTQEDFTPENIVRQLIDNVGTKSITNLNKKVLDFSCGNGNILVYVLNKRIEKCETNDDIVKAISSIYGVDIMADNVEECRQRLYDLIIEKFPSVTENKSFDYKIKSIIRNRIQWHDALCFDYKWPTLAGRPRKKHENITFKVYKKPCDTKYPMWAKNIEEKVTQLEIEF